MRNLVFWIMAEYTYQQLLMYYEPVGIVVDRKEAAIDQNFLGQMAHHMHRYDNPCDPKKDGNDG